MSKDRRAKLILKDALHRRLTNKERDKNNANQILSMDWKVITIWDCEIQQKDNMDTLVQKIVDLLHEVIPRQPKAISIKIYEEMDENVSMVAEDIVQYKKKKGDISSLEF